MADKVDGASQSTHLNVESGGSGGDALAGYDYQIDVSVWLALDLMLASKLTQELVLEPVSEEDIEAKLDESEVGPVATRVSLNGYTLVVQAKLRGGDAWTVAGLKNLLKHGSDHRLSAAERLEDGNVRYLLVTSAALNGPTRALKVLRAGSWPRAVDLPKEIVKALPEGATGRVAVIGGLDEARLVREIKDLLIERFRVPNARWGECLQVLREAARVRVSRGGNGRWQRDDLERVVHQHDGYLASTPELEHYVHPTNWPELLTVMRTRHAALIIGQSGTGKTLATRKLYEVLRTEFPGLQHVPIRGGPHKLRDDRTPSPVLYDIEDPWGRFDFDPDSRPWNDQLSQWFAQASHDRMIVATTRRDVAQATGALDTVEPWLFALEVEHYGKDERSRLYRTRIEGLSRDLQLVAADAEARVLSKLATPLEIQKFFDALRDLDRDLLKHPASFIEEAINRAHQNSIERTVIDQIQQRGDVRAAAIIWALMKAADKLSLGLVREMEPELADKEPKLEKGVTPFVNFLIAARNLRAGEGTASYYHPRVEAGIERALKYDPLPVGRILRILIDLLLDPAGPGEAWGAGMAARILAAVNERLPEVVVKPLPGSTGKIDDWLTTQLAQGGTAFEDNLRLAAAAGSPASNASELARYLLHRPDKTFGFFHCWAAPLKDEAWYARLRGDPIIKPLLETFIQEVLPTTHDDYPVPLVEEIERIATGLTPAFLTAAKQAVTFGVIPSVDVIAEGALRNLDGFEPIVDAAIAVRTPSEDELREIAEVQLSITNGVYSHDYAEYLNDQGSEDGYCAGEFLEHYVKRVRDVRGWQSLVGHRHAEQLHRYWIREVADQAKRSEPDSDEFAAVFAAGYDGRDEDDLWSVLWRWWDDRYRAVLRARVHDGHPERRVRQAALACLVKQMPTELHEIVRELLGDNLVARALELALDLAHLQNSRDEDGEAHGSAVGTVATTLPPPYGELCSAARALQRRKQLVLSPQAYAVLSGAEHGSEDVRRFRIQAAKYVDLPCQEDIRWILATSDDDQVAAEAVERAIQLGMHVDVEEALDHKFAKVSALALAALGASATLPLPERLLAMVDAAGSPIRKALAELLASRPHPDHLPALLRLAKDHWSSSSRYYGENDAFPIARTAVEAIGTLAPLSATDAEQLYAMAIDTSDRQLRIGIFKLLATTGRQSMQERLLEMAVAPGRAELHEAAASALLQACDATGLDVVARITPDILTTQPPTVATNLALLFTIKADLASVINTARALATHEKRRVLLVLMIRILAGRDQASAQTVEALLPKGHPAVAWAFGNQSETLDDALLADLGDPASCAQVLLRMKRVQKTA
ncbi:hypothetical protein E8F11_22005 [Pseudomonas sp. BN417]|uniref:nSTAND3 domain-containing NTPase n=1 Tax=Pseudomonas sp. BN417 TaxID=2567890 RepID=UPI0024538E30|nr:hypothetical protein [Pseudomonas sp. BN417]MDH4557811.1 hypothetical protein [Pseudomonas sp. BN417]